MRFKAKAGGHNVRWWSEEAASIAAFRAEHVRNPWPEHLIWETDDPSKSGRAFWLVIHEIGDESANNPDPLNTVLFPELEPPTRAEAFPRHGPSGRVELVRDGNTVQVRTRNVKRLEILLGVDVFDFGDVELHVSARELLKTFAKTLGLGSTPTNNNSWTTSEYLNNDLLTQTLDLDARYGATVEFAV